MGEGRECLRHTAIRFSLRETGKLHGELCYNSGMRNLLAIALLLAACACGADEERILSTWDLPRVFPQHSMYRARLVDALRRGDIPGMESVCRAALTVLPGDATWHYNLACALAYREKPDLALEELDKAIGFGFRDADAIAKDQDFARIHDLPRFKELVEKARALAGQPVPGHPVPAPAYATAGATATLCETNLVFDFEAGVYDALLQLAPPPKPLNEMVTNFHASVARLKLPETAIVRGYLADGTAAGNAGDLYVNRDRGHSRTVFTDFPHLTDVRFAASARPFNVDVNHPNTRFPGHAVFGNISRGITSGFFWRSMARASFTEPGLAARMDLLYRSNQFWVLPCVNDFGKPELGDVFPVNAPFQLVSQGASWSDLPFLQAALSASASFLRPTKQAILRRRLMGPTLQWLLRRTQVGVKSESDYLRAGSHPAAFSSKRINAVALVEMAHALQPADIPPAVSLAMINSRTFPIRFPVPGEDYPDNLSEVLFNTSSAIGIVLRGTEGERTFLFRAQPFPEQDPDATYTWRVVNGDAGAVKIGTPLGETFNTPERGFAQITVDRRALTGRIDVACFAKTHGTEYGAPSIISFSVVPQEKRVYRPDGRLESIDYSNPEMAYSDPAIALPRRWKDTYVYTPAGDLLGFSRSYNGQEAAFFTPKGARVTERNPDGSPKRAVAVAYTARQTGNKIQPLELTYTDSGEPFDVK